MQNNLRRLVNYTIDSLPYLANLVLFRSGQLGFALMFPAYMSEDYLYLFALGSISLFSFGTYFYLERDQQREERREREDGDEIEREGLLERSPSPEIVIVRDDRQSFSDQIRNRQNSFNNLNSL